MTLTHDMIGLPQELFEAMKHMVFTHEVRRVPQFYIKRVPNYVNGRLTKDPVTGSFFRHEVSARLTAPTTKQLPQYGLNAMRDLIHEFNYEYMGQNEEGDFIFFKDEVKFIKDDQYYFTPSDEKLLAFRWGTINASCQLEGKDPDTYRAKLTYSITVNNVTTRYNIDEVYAPEQVAAMLNITPEQFEQEVYVRWIGEYRNPDRYITSVFTDIVADTVAYKGATFVNGELFNGIGYGQKITCYNKFGVDYITRWKLYNGCDGNFGQCSEIGPVSSGDEDVAHSFIFDPSKPHAVLELQLEELPAQGKNWTVSAYLDLKTGQRLHELPKQIGDGVTML